MVTRNSKLRLFEVMQKVDKTFKPNLNEDYMNTNNVYDEIINNFQGHAKQVNSIDSPQYKWYVDVLNFINGNNNIIQKAELIKFFQNNFLGMDYGDFNSNEELINWWLSPEQQDFIKSELNSNEGQIDEAARGVNPKYTHFAVLKSNNKILNGWDYRGYDSEELKLDKKHYFYNDIKDMQIDPKITKVVTTKYLQRLGIDPFNFDNWNKDQSIFTLENVIKENQEEFKRLVVFLIYDKNGTYLGDLDPIDEMESNYIERKSDVIATPEFQKFAKEKNITPEQIGKISKDSQYSMNGNILGTEYYAPSDSEELYDEKTKTFYNRSGQQMRNPSEFRDDGEGYTPFGDEGSDY